MPPKRKQSNRDKILASRAAVGGTPKRGSAEVKAALAKIKASTGKSVTRRQGGNMTKTAANRDLHGAINTLRASFVRAYTPTGYVSVKTGKKVPAPRSAPPPSSAGSGTASSKGRTRAPGSSRGAEPKGTMAAAIHAQTEAARKRELALARRHKGTSRPTGGPASKRPTGWTPEAKSGWAEIGAGLKEVDTHVLWPIQHAAEKAWKWGNKPLRKPKKK